MRVPITIKVNKLYFIDTPLIIGNKLSIIAS